MAVVLENMPTAPVASRIAISAIYRTAQLVASVPNVSYCKKVTREKNPTIANCHIPHGTTRISAFPEALFHQLLRAMAHPDHGTRVGAHRVFSAVLMPSLTCPRRPSFPVSSKTYSSHQSLSIVLSGFSSSDSILEKAGEMSFPVQNASSERKYGPGTTSEGLKENPLCNDFLEESQAGGIDAKHCRAYPCCSQCHSVKPSPVWSVKEGTMVTKSKMESTSPEIENTAASFEAMAETYNLALMFAQSKMDPYLRLTEDNRLQAVDGASDGGRRIYGSEEDEANALKSFLGVGIDSNQLKEAELSTVRMKLQQEFLPDDGFSLGASLFKEIPQSCSPLAPVCQDLDEIRPPSSVLDEDAFFETSKSRLGYKKSLSVHAIDILSVNQLIESVLEAAKQIISIEVSTTPLPYDQVKNQCEALVVGKQQKMSVLLSFKQQPGPLCSSPSDSNKKECSVLSYAVRKRVLYFTTIVSVLLE
ncbi:hypothetical protein ACLOJK_009025 [Asimina triloba]